MRRKLPEEKPDKLRIHALAEAKPERDPFHLLGGGINPRLHLFIIKSQCPPLL